MSESNVFLSSLIAGGAAGLAVDISLFPLDTIKTRLQAPQGFIKAGGFKGIYKGLGPQSIGSAPTGLVGSKKAGRPGRSYTLNITNTLHCIFTTNFTTFLTTTLDTLLIKSRIHTYTIQESNFHRSYTSFVLCDLISYISSQSATFLVVRKLVRRQSISSKFYFNIRNTIVAALFFCTYEGFKSYATPLVLPEYVPIVHMTAASLGEVVACTVRVPVEVVKQRRQTTIGKSSVAILMQAYQTEGIFKGLYRGFSTTVLREIPFAFIQFPIYEYFKLLASKFFCDGGSVPSYQVSICGALAGGIAAASTTPLDVAKTRIMLAEKKLSFAAVLSIVYRENGFRGLFAGFVPRVLWITLGGAIFFGAYDVSKNFTTNFILPNKHEQGIS